jgi:secreted Zn-dependent insulinase-like peptidase
LFEVIQEEDFDPDRFNNIRNDIVRELQNTAAQRPSSQVMADLGEAILRRQWGEDALIGPLQDATLESMREHMATFWRNASAEVLVYGNYPSKVTDDLSRMLDDMLANSEAPARVPVEVLKLDAEASFQYQVDVPHDDSVVAWYLQGADNTWEDRTATGLTAQIMKSGFFQQLRTEQQLGYVVSAFSWNQQTIPGLVMLIQSPVADAPSVLAAMEAFLDAVPGDLTEEQFDRHKEALKREILRPHKNLGERADYYWSSILYQRLDFDGREQAAAALEQLSYEDWQAYFADVFLSGGYSLRVVAPGKWDLLPGDGEEPVEAYDSAGQLKRDKPFYQLP